MGFGAIIFNYIGGVVRWILGSIWRSIVNKPKYEFDEYINGINNSDDIFDTAGHELVNKIIGCITLVLFCWLIIQLGF